MQSITPSENRAAFRPPLNSSAQQHTAGRPPPNRPDNTNGATTSGHRSGGSSGSPSGPRASCPWSGSGVSSWSGSLVGFSCGNLRAARNQTRVSGRSAFSMRASPSPAPHGHPPTSVPPRRSLFRSLSLSLPAGMHEQPDGTSNEGERERETKRGADGGGARFDWN